MEFLKEILGEELYKQMTDKLNAYNSDDANKERQIRLENINSGNYVSKMKFEDLTTQLGGKEAELKTANETIAELKKLTNGNNDVQEKINAYEQEIKDLQKQMDDVKINSAVKVALLSAKAKDIDYLTFKMNENLKKKGEVLKLDENENIKGWSEKLESLKTQFPTMFESDSESKKVQENKLPTGDDHEPSEPKSLEEALKMKFEKQE